MTRPFAARTDAFVPLIWTCQPTEGTNERQANHCQLSAAAGGQGSWISCLLRCCRVVRSPRDHHPEAGASAVLDGEGRGQRRSHASGAL